MDRDSTYQTTGGFWAKASCSGCVCLAIRSYRKASLTYHVLLQQSVPEHHPCSPGKHLHYPGQRALPEAGNLQRRPARRSRSALLRGCLAGAVAMVGTTWLSLFCAGNDGGI